MFLISAFLLAKEKEIHVIGFTLNAPRFCFNARVYSRMMLPPRRLERLTTDQKSVALPTELNSDEVGTVFTTYSLCEVKYTIDPTILTDPTWCA